LNELCIKKEISLLLISHELKDVIRYTDDIYVLYKGNIMEVTNTSHAAISAKTSGSIHPYTKNLLQVADGNFGFMQIQESFSSHLDRTDDTLKNESKGCPYYNYCGLRKSLSEASQNKCLNEKPALRKISKNNKIACWHVD